MARKGKGKGKGDADAAVDPAAAAAAGVRRGLSLADHPRATAQIRTVRASVAVAAFLFVLLLSLRATVPLEGALTRALEAGVLGYVVAWAAMVMAWRQLAQAEIESARRQIVAAMLEMEAADRDGKAAS
jgi:hypothetical protein